MQLYTEDQIKAFTYCLHWTAQNISYYGVRYKEGCRTTDLWTKYYSSSDEVKKFREQYGEPDIVLIDQQFLDVQEALAYEVEILQENDVRNNENFLNMTDAAAPFTPSGKKHHNFGKKGDKSPLFGIKRSEETRRKLRESKLGEKNPAFGKKHSEEHCLKISNALKGIKSVHYGTKRSKEVLAKISNSLLGVTAGEKHYLYDHVKRVFKHKDGREFIGTQHKFRHEFDLRQQHVSAMVTGKVCKNGYTRKSVNGWSYIGIEEEEQ